MRHCSTENISVRSTADDSHDSLLSLFLTTTVYRNINPLIFCRWFFVNIRHSDPIRLACTKPFYGRSLSLLTVQGFHFSFYTTIKLFTRGFSEYTCTKAFTQSPQVFCWSENVQYTDGMLPAASITITHIQCQIMTQISCSILLTRIFTWIPAILPTWWVSTLCGVSSRVIRRFKYVLGLSGIAGIIHRKWL